MGVSEWFPVDVGWGQGCVLSRCLFSVYIENGVVAEANAGVFRKGLELLSVYGGRF